MNSGERSVENLIASISQPIQEWKKPDQFDLSSRADRNELTRRFDRGEINATVDRSIEIANDLFDMQYPALKDDDRARQDFVGEIQSQGAAFGTWFAFDWKGTLERYPDKDDHHSLRTFRNKNLITDVEQRALLDAKVAVFGMSVGSNVVEQLVLSGIGGTMVMGDYDTLSPSNLNRIKAAMSQVGMKKLDLIASKVSEVDPYTEQIHFKDGVTESSLAQLAEVRPRIIFDEIDDLATKALLRRFAADERIPLVMASDVGDRSVVDVERYDIERCDPFNGRISEAEVEELLNDELDSKRRQKMMTKIIGVSNITPRLFASAMEKDRTLGGLPQLGTTASIGGSLAALAAREIILDRRLKSGRYVFSPNKMLNMQSASSFVEGAYLLLSAVKMNR